MRTGLDLDGNQCSLHLDEEIDLPRPEPEVASDDASAAIDQEVGGDLLAE